MKYGSFNFLEPSGSLQGLIYLTFHWLPAVVSRSVLPAVLFSDNTDVTVLFVSFFPLCYSFAFRSLTRDGITAHLHICRLRVRQECAVLFQCNKSVTILIAACEPLRVSWWLSALGSVF